MPLEASKAVVALEGRKSFFSGGDFSWEGGGTLPFPNFSYKPSQDL